MVYGGAALVLFSPVLIGIGLNAPIRYAARSRAIEIMKKLQPGALLDGGGEAFARAHGKQVVWSPSAYTPGYGVLTVDQGVDAVSVISSDDLPKDPVRGAAKIGVRDDRVEWLAFDSAGATCGRNRDNISSYRPGCRQGVQPFGTR